MVKTKTLIFFLYISLLFNCECFSNLQESALNTMTYCYWFTNFNRSFERFVCMKTVIFLSRVQSPLTLQVTEQGCLTFNNSSVSIASVCVNNISNEACRRKQTKLSFCKVLNVQRYFLAFDFCRFFVVIRFFPSPPQRPMTSNFKGFSIPDFIHYIYFPILILEKEPVFSLLNVQC